MDPMGNVIMWLNHVKTMSFLPPMTGNGKHTTIYGDDWGIVYHCYNVIFTTHDWEW